MEECQTSLGDMLEERHELKSGPLPAVQMRKVCQDMCEALDYLHNTAKLLHGDIKSFNVSELWLGGWDSLDFKLTLDILVL